jgi:hypothetical protein
VNTSSPRKPKRLVVFTPSSERGQPALTRLTKEQSDPAVSFLAGPLRSTLLQRQAASYVDCILRGEEPTKLPVQAPTKYELAINLKTLAMIPIKFTTHPRSERLPVTSMQTEQKFL